MPAEEPEDDARTDGPAMLTWESDERCTVGGVTFQTLPADLLAPEHPSISMEGADFLLFKVPPLIDRYVDVVGELAPRRIVELGILEGGSTAFLFELARPQGLIAVDQKPPTTDALREHLARRDADGVVRTHTGTDQADRAQLGAIVGDAFGREPLDLVVDDCSHLYEPTRASFNELFPRLRPGGLYVIEDWPWAHTGEPNGLWPDEVPLTRFIFELLLAIPACPGLIADVAVYSDSAVVRRGQASVDPRGFDVIDCADDRGRRLLASE